MGPRRRANLHSHKNLPPQSPPVCSTYAKLSACAHKPNAKLKSKQPSQQYYGSSPALRVGSRAAECSASFTNMRSGWAENHAVDSKRSRIKIEILHNSAKMRCKAGSLALTRKSQSHECAPIRRGTSLACYSWFTLEVKKAARWRASWTTAII